MQNTRPNTLTIDDLRTHLFETLTALRKGEMDLDRARTIADVSRVVVDSAKVEVAFLQTTGALKSTGFLPDGDEDAEAQNRLAQAGQRRLAAVPK